MSNSKILLPFAFTFCALMACAETRTWSGGAGCWGDATKWTPEGVPTATSDVVIPPGSTNVVSNALCVASLELQGTKSSPTKLIFAAKNATHTVAGSVNLGAYTTVTHADNFKYILKPSTSTSYYYCNPIQATAWNAYTTMKPEQWYAVNLTVGGNMTIAENAKIDVTGAGFGPGLYSGLYNKDLISSHAGVAPQNFNATSSTNLKKFPTANDADYTYGLIRHPTSFGGGGKRVPNISSYYLLEAQYPLYLRGGGGAVHLAVTGRLTVNGDILAMSAYRNSSYTYGNGAGGSIWLETTELAGSGTIDVRPCCKLSKTNYGATGSAGRIAIYQTVSENLAAFTGKLNAGLAYDPDHPDYNNYNTSAPGTIYIENANDIVGFGELIIDAGGRTPFNLTNWVGTANENACREINCARVTSAMLEGKDTFRKVTVKGSGVFTVASGVALKGYTVNTNDAALVTAGISGYGTLTQVAAPTEGTLVITGEPQEYSVGELPQYFSTPQTKTVDSITHYDAPTAPYTGLANGYRAVIAGYRIDRKRDGVNWSLGTNCLGHTSIDYRQLNSADARLMWIWTNEVHVTVSTTVPDGKVSFDGVNWSSGSATGWFRINTPVVIYGGEGTEQSYVWSGLPADATYDGRRYRVVTFKATQPKEVSVADRPVATITVAGDPDNTYLIEGAPDYSRFFLEDGESRAFAAPIGYQSRSETVRALVMGYRLDGGSMVEALSYAHTQSGLANHALTWCWTNEVKFTVHNSSEFAEERFSRIDGGTWGGDLIGWARPRATVTIYGGEDAARYYSWKGLPDGATFDDDDHKRVATFAMPSETFAVDVHMIPQPGVFVESEPRAYQTGGSPEYGVSAMTAGSSQTFTATDAPLVIDSGVRTRVAGYRLDTWDESTRSWIRGETVLDALSYTHDQPDSTARTHLVWLWTNEVKVVVRAATEGEKVQVSDGPWCEITNAWQRIGVPVSVKGSESSAVTHLWSGTPSDATWDDPTLRTIATFAPTNPLNISVTCQPANLKDWNGGEGCWGDPEMWTPWGVPRPNHDVTIPAGSTIVVSNAIDIASLDLQGTSSAETKLTFATKWATNKVAGAVTLGDYTTLTHEKNWHWYQSGNYFYSIAVNVKDSTNTKDYTTTKPQIWYTLNLSVGGDMTVAAGAKIDVTEAGYGPGWTPDGRDATMVNTSSSTHGALPVHAGVSSCGWKTVSAVTRQKQAFTNCSDKATYGSVRRPITPGSGNYYNTSYSSYKYGFGGGGIVHLMVAGELNLEGEILSRSGCQTSAHASGTGAGGSVWLEASAVTGSGTIDVRGGDFGGNKDYAPNSSAGRIAIYQTAATANPTNLQLKAGSAANVVSGSTVVNGANGSIYIENAGDTKGRGELVVDYGDKACYNLTNTTTYASDCKNVNCLLLTAASLDGETAFRQITVRNNGILTVEKGVTLTTDYLMDAGRGVVTANTSGSVPTLGTHYTASGYGSITITAGTLPVPPTPTPPPIPPEPEPDPAPTVNPPAARGAVAMTLVREGYKPVYTAAVSPIEGKSYEANSLEYRWFGYAVTNTLAAALAANAVEFLGRGATIPDGNGGKMCYAEIVDADGFVVRTEPVFVTTLPIVNLKTDPAQTPTEGISDEPTFKKESHTGSMSVTGNGVFGDVAELEIVDIHCRGNLTSRNNYSKLPYKVKLAKKTDLFGMGKQKHWVLLANYFDPSLLNNVVASDLFRACGGCSMDTVWVEVFLNGKYRGVYQFCEQIRVDKNRVAVHDWEDDAKDVAEAISPTDATLADALEETLSTNWAWITSREFKHGGTTYHLDDYPTLPTSYDLTGGYLVALDYYGPDDGEVCLSTSTHGMYLNLNKNSLFAKSPKYINTNQQMFNYLSGEMDDLQAAIQTADGYFNGRHTSEIFDVDSAAAYWIVQTFTDNGDAVVASRYIYKPHGEKLIWGPAWDFADNALLNAFNQGPWKYAEENGVRVVTKDAFNFNSISAMDWGLIDQEKTNFFPFLADDPYFCLRLWEMWQDLAPYLDELLRDGGQLDQYTDELSGSADCNNRYFPTTMQSGGGAFLELSSGERIPMPFSGIDGLANGLKRWLVKRRACWDEPFKDLPSLLKHFDYVLQMTADRRLRHPALTPTPSFQFTPTCAYSDRTAGAQEGLTDFFVTTDTPVTGSVYVGNDTAKKVAVYVNGLSNGVYEVVHTTAEIQVPVEQLTNPEGRRNMIQFVGLDADGARVGQGYALVELTAAPEPPTPTLDEQVDNVRWWGFCGQPPTGDDAEGEFIILTNLNQSAAVSLEGLQVRICKVGDAVAKCQFTLGADASIAAGGFIRLDHADYPAGWSKITNGEVDLQLTSVQDAIFEEYQLSQSTLGVKGTGKFAVRDFATVAGWTLMDIADAPTGGGGEGPKPSPAEAFQLAGDYTEPLVLYSATNATVKLAGMTSVNTIILKPTSDTLHPTFTIEYAPDTTNEIEILNYNVPAIDARDCDLVITGAGVGKFTSKKKIAGSGVIHCRNLTVLGGETAVKFDTDKDDTACVFLTGSYLQQGGLFKVSMPKSMNLKKDLVTVEQVTNRFNGVLFDTKNTTFTLENGNFEAKVGGVKSAGLSLKKSCTANLNGGELDGSICGEDGRIIAGGTINFAGTECMVALDETTEEKGVVMTNHIDHARVFKADKALNVTAGSINITVGSAQSEGLGSDEAINISGGAIEIVAGDDAIQCEGNITISGGRTYVKSLYGDGIDANGDITINDGLVLAYAFASEEKGLDVNNAGVISPEAPAGTLTIAGGKVVALGGPGSKSQGNFVGTQPTYRGYNLAAADYSEKFLILEGTNALAAAETTAVKLPASTNETCSLIVSVPSMTSTAAPKTQTETPEAGSLDFHDVYVYPTENPIPPPEPPPHTHTYGDWVTNQFVSCTNDGIRVRTCTAAGCETPPVAETNIYETALGHDWGEWYTNVAPTVEAAGELRRDCQRKDCEAYETEVLPPLDPPTPPGENLIQNPTFALKSDTTVASAYYGTAAAKVGDWFNSTNVFYKYLTESNWYAYWMGSDTGSEYRPGWKKSATHTADGTAAAHCRKTDAVLCDFTVPKGQGGTYVLDFYAMADKKYTAYSQAAKVTAYIVPKSLMATKKFCATNKKTIYPYIVQVEHYSTHQMTNSVLLVDASWHALTGSVKLEPGDYTLAFCNAIHNVESTFYTSSYAGLYLDDISLKRAGTPTPTVVTIAFSLGTGVTSASYKVGEEAAVTVVDAQEVEMTSNATFTVSAAADSNNWYRITGGTGEYVADEEKTVTITASNETPENPTSADYGLKGPFAESSSEEVRKVMGWAKTNGKTSAEMSALDFTTPGVTEKAYLFNVADDAKAVEAAEKAFAFTAIEPGTVPEPQTLVTPNGTVETQGANALAPANWEAPATSSHRFYRAILKK